MTKAPSGLTRLTPSELENHMKDLHETNRQTALYFYEHKGFKPQWFEEAWSKLMSMDQDERIKHMHYCKVNIDLTQKLTKDQLIDLVVYIWC